MNVRSIEKNFPLFRFLSRAFAYPDAAMQQQLREEADEDSPFQKDFKDVAAAFEKEEILELQAEYTRLFISGHPTTPCPPYESFYREGRLMGAVVYDIMRVYQEWGLQAELGLVDHISTELEFLNYLISAIKLPELSRHAREALNQFYQEHISRWFGKFGEELYKRARLQPYRLLGEMVKRV